MAKIVRGSGVISPLATAVWLVDNTTLTFKQIGDFCNLDEREVQSIADGLIAKGIIPNNPIKCGNLTSEEIKAREKDGKPLNNTFTALKGYEIKVQKQKKYTPMLQRQSRPEAVLWLLNYCKELSDAQIIRLVRTTKNMIQMIRDKRYDGYNDLVAKDPVIIGFCTQRDLDFEVERAKNKGGKVVVKKEKKVKKVKIKKPKIKTKNIKKVKKVKKVLVKVKKTSIKKPSKKSSKK